MNIPAVIGVGDDFLTQIKDGDEAIVDGFTGKFFINPDAETKEKMLQKQKDDEDKKDYYKSLKAKENSTLDGTKIIFFANIGSVDNIWSCSYKRCRWNRSFQK